MDHFREVVGHLNARFPGEFECKAGMKGRAQGLEVRCGGRSGYAFIFEPSGRSDFLLSLHEDDDDQNAEVWKTANPEECVQRILPWAFPHPWTAPAPIDRAKEERRLAKIAVGLAARTRINCQVGDERPDLIQLLSADQREALDRDLASLSIDRVKNQFPWDHAGQLALKTTVLLRAYPTQGAAGRVVSLAAIGPERRRDVQSIQIELAALIPANHTHRWHDRPWMWQNVAPPDDLEAGLQREPDSLAERSLALLDQGKIEDALSLHGVTLSEELHRLLGGQRISPPACCAHPDQAWTELLIDTLRQSAPWLLPTAALNEAERIRECTGRMPSKRALTWKLVVFPGQFHARKASLMISADRDGRNPRLLIEATATNARLADTSWKRRIEVDFRRYGMRMPWSV